SSCSSSCFPSNVATAWEGIGAADRNRKRRPPSEQWWVLRLAYSPLFLHSPSGWQPHALIPGDKCYWMRRTRLERPIYVRACFRTGANKFADSFETTLVLV